MPVPKVKVRKKPQNKRCKDGYPCKRSCISRTKNCKAPLKWQAKTFLLWEKAQQERLALTNKKRERAGLTPAQLNDSKYITAERTKLPQSAIAKVETAIASPVASESASVSSHPIGRDTDMRGFSFGVTNASGQVVISGSVPLLGDKSHELSSAGYYFDLANRVNGKLYVAPTNTKQFSVPEKTNLIVGKTWEQIQSMQQKQSVPELVKSKMPEGARMVYDASPPPSKPTATTREQLIAEEIRLGKELDVILNKYPGRRTDEQKAEIKAKESEYFAASRAIRNFNDGKAVESPTVAEVKPIIGAEVKSAIAVPSKTETIGTILKVGAKQVDLPKPLSSYSNLNLSHDPSLGWQVTDKDGDVLRQPKTNGQVNSHRFKERSQAENFAKTVMAKVDRAIVKQEKATKSEQTKATQSQKEENAIAEKPPHESTLNEFIEQEKQKLLKIYPSAATSQAGLKMNADKAQDKWLASLNDYAQKGRLSDRVIDSFVEKFGEKDLNRTFRGVTEKGIQGWVPKDLRGDRPSVKEEKAALEDLARIRVDDTPKTTGSNSDAQPRGLDSFLNGTTVSSVANGFNQLSNGIRSGEKLKAEEKLLKAIAGSNAFTSSEVGATIAKSAVQLSNGKYVIPSKLNPSQKQALKDYQAEIKAIDKAFDRRSQIFTDQVMAPEFKNAKISEAQKVELAQSVGRTALEETDVEKYIKPSTTKGDRASAPSTPKPEMTFEDKMDKVWEPYVESAKKALPSGKRGKIDRGAATLYGDYAIGSDGSGKWKVTHGALGIATKLPSKESAQVFVHAMTETFGKKTFDQLAKESGLSANDFYSDHWRPTIDSLDEAVRSRDADKIKAIAKSYVPPKAKPEPEKVAQKPEVVPPVAKVDDKEFYQPTAKEFGDRLTLTKDDFKDGTLFLGVSPTDNYSGGYTAQRRAEGFYGALNYGKEYRLIKEGDRAKLEYRAIAYSKGGDPIKDKRVNGDWQGYYGTHEIGSAENYGLFDLVAREGIAINKHPFVANAESNVAKRQAEQAQREKEARIESDKKQEKETAWAAIKKEMVAALPKPKKNQSVSWQGRDGETVTSTADFYGENYMIAKYRNKFFVSDRKSGNMAYATGLTAADAKDLLGILWKERGDKPLALKDGKADVPKDIAQIAVDYSLGQMKSIPDRYSKEVEDRVNSVNSQKAQAMQSNLFGGLDEIPVDKKREDAIAVQSSVESTKKLDAVDKFRPYVKPKKDNISDKEMEQRIKESNDYFQSIARGEKPGRPTWLDKQASSVDTGRSIAGVGLTPTTKGFVAEQLFKLSAFDFPSAKDYEGDPPKVTVRTPGGGQYQIYKTKEAISTFLDAIGLSPKKGETLFDALKRNSEIVQNFSEPTLSPCDHHLLLLATTAANRIMSYPESLRQGIVNRLRGQLA